MLALKRGEAVFIFDSARSGTSGIEVVDQPTVLEPQSSFVFQRDVAGERTARQSYGGHRPRRENEVLVSLRDQGTPGDVPSICQ
jgi:hypothetical protein